MIGATRIRYTKRVTDNETYLVSRQVFTLGGAALKVILDITNMKYRIVNENTNDVVVHGGSPIIGTIRTLKKHAKQALEELGYKFESDKRVKNDEKSQ